MWTWKQNYYLDLGLGWFLAFIWRLVGWMWVKRAQELLREWAQHGVLGERHLDITPWSHTQGCAAPCVWKKFRGNWNSCSTELIVLDVVLRKWRESVKCCNYQPNSKAQESIKKKHRGALPSWGHHVIPLRKYLSNTMKPGSGWHLSAFFNKMSTSSVHVIHQ